MRCEDCGNHTVHRREVAGHLVLECDLCGYLDGQDEDVQAVLQHREAEARGIDHRVYPLVQALDLAPGIKVLKSGAGDADGGLAPFVQFSLPEGRLKPLEHLHQTLRMSATQTKLPWRVKLSFNRTLIFTLAPVTETSPGRRGMADVQKARADLAVLAECLTRDLSLQFWRA